MSHFSGKVQDRNAILLLKMFGFWLHWAFVAAYRLSLVEVQGLLSVAASLVVASHQL